MKKVKFILSLCFLSVFFLNIDQAVAQTQETAKNEKKKTKVEQKSAIRTVVSPGASATVPQKSAEKHPATPKEKGVKASGKTKKATQLNQPKRKQKFELSETGKKLKAARQKLKEN